MKKMNIKNTVKGGLLAAIFMIATSCELQDHLVDPSQLSPDQGSNEFVFNTAQLNFEEFVFSAAQLGMDNTRMLAIFGDTYENAYTANSFNEVWSSGYSGFMVNANLLLSKTVENAATTEIEYNPYYQGTMKVLKAYVIITLVDYFGDIPYSKAFNTDDFNAPVDKGADIYIAALALLDAAIIDLNAVTAGLCSSSRLRYSIHVHGLC